MYQNDWLFTKLLEKVLLRSTNKKVHSFNTKLLASHNFYRIFT